MRKTEYRIYSLAAFAMGVVAIRGQLEKNSCGSQVYEFLEWYSKERFGRSSPDQRSLLEVENTKIANLQTFELTVWYGNKPRVVRILGTPIRDKWFRESCNISKVQVWDLDSGTLAFETKKLPTKLTKT